MKDKKTYLKYIFLTCLIVFIAHQLGFLTVYQKQTFDLYFPSSMKDSNAHIADIDMFGCTFNHNLKVIETTDEYIKMQLSITNYQETGSSENPEGFLDIIVEPPHEKLHPPESNSMSVKPSWHGYSILVSSGSIKFTVISAHTSGKIGDWKWEAGSNYGASEWFAITSEVDAYSKFHLRLSINGNGVLEIKVRRAQWKVSYVAEVEVTAIINGYPYPDAFIYNQRGTDKYTYRLGDGKYLIPIYLGENKITVEWNNRKIVKEFHGSVFKAAPSKLRIEAEVPEITILLNGEGKLKVPVEVKLFYFNPNYETAKKWLLYVGTELPLKLVYPSPSDGEIEVWVAPEGWSLMKEKGSGDRDLTLNFNIYEDILEKGGGETGGAEEEVEEVTFTVQIVDSAGNPVKGVSVKVINADTRGFVEAKSTDSEGKAVFTVEKGRYYIYAVVDGATVWVSQGEAVEVEDGAVYKVKLSSSVETQPIEEPSQTEETGENETTEVVDAEDDTPIEGIKVEHGSEVEVKKQLIRRIASILFYTAVAGALIVIIWMLRKEVQ